MVWSGTLRVEPEEPKHVADKALCLAQGELEDQPQHQHQLDRQIRVTGLAAWCRPPCRLPAGERCLVQPERQVAPAAKAGIVLRPVPYPILRPRDVVPAGQVVLERQRMSLLVSKAVCLLRPSPARQPPCTNASRLTTRSTTSFISAAITSPPPSFEPPGPKLT